MNNKFKWINCLYDISRSFDKAYFKAPRGSEEEKRYKLYAVTTTTACLIYWFLLVCLYTQFLYFFTTPTLILSGFFLFNPIKNLVMGIHKEYKALRKDSEEEQNNS